MEKPDEDIMMEYQSQSQSRSKSGDRKAIQVIFQRYKIRILDFCIRLLGNRADAEEVSGEVFLALLKTRYTPDPGAKFSTWLYTIARNQCISRIRKRKNHLALWASSDQWDIPDTANPNPTREQAAQKEMARRVRQAISKLPREQKEAIILRQYHGFRYEQISRVLNCSLEKVKILIFRARERLRIELASFIKEEQS